VQTVADIGLIDGNLAAKDEVWIELVLGDGSDLQMGLGLPFLPHVDVVDHVVAAQVAAPCSASESAATTLDS
jgi:hypothetical protein